MPGSRWKGEGAGKEKGESVMCSERVRAEWGRSWLLWWDGSCCLGLGMLRPALSNHAQSRDKYDRFNYLRPSSHATKPHHSARSSYDGTTGNDQLLTADPPLPPTLPPGTLINAGQVSKAGSRT